MSIDLNEKEKQAIGNFFNLVSNKDILIDIFFKYALNKGMEAVNEIIETMPPELKEIVKTKIKISNG